MLVALAPTPALAQPVDREPAASTPAALMFLQRDWVLMNWALKFYDRTTTSCSSQPKPQAAADEFRKIADGNGDGRVTPQEYRAAREFILARY